ncbi:MAG: hypothetical protein JRE43_10230 [Deltaproteobacteria bacterium]|jgi:hypothetical protein|nr:hypothetical protein [Deltaproteobacteria bacterium]MBW2541430.1 hypothetical protein [Deltaproteobacteria bacterium]
MNARSGNPAAETGTDRRGEGVRPEPPRWARWLRRALLWGVGLLYAASIPWYRGDAPPARLFGLPDWVAIAILCYAAAAILNSIAWLLTDVPEPTADEEARRP